MVSTTRQVRAPELVGAGGWIGVEGTPRLADLRGRFVLLDFWTFCCINCLHVLEELRPLEARFSDVLTVVGVHSPKFVHESDHDAVIAAVQRHGIEHPVLDDPDLTTWQAFAVRAWPTLVLIDPEGYVVAQYSGEGHVHALGALLTELVAEHEQRGTLRRGPVNFSPPAPEPTTLRFPGKVLALPGGTFLVSDSGHHSLVELAADLETVVRRFGTGERGLVDGGPGQARFNEPQGLCLLPDDVREQVGYDVLVADTVNHALRGLRLDDATVTTVAGTGAPWMQGDPAPGGDPRTAPMSSPWDVTWSGSERAVVVAMAGIHQLWRLDPLVPAISVLAGTTNEGLVDGPVAQAWFAQTSGLAVTSGTGHDVAWMADAETSALRRLDLGAEPTVTTVVGTGLFDFGLRDGAAEQALLQHPLGVAALPDGSIAIADTYNGAVRRYDPATGTVATMASGLREPSGLVVDGAQLVVVESAAHRLTRIPLGAAVTDAVEFGHRTQRPSTTLAAGTVELRVTFQPPPGQKLDERYGPATRLLVSATPDALLRSGAGRDTGLHRTIELDPTVGEGVLHVAASAASCDGDAEFAACHVHQQDWGVPVVLSADGPAQLELVLGGAATGE